MAALFSRPRALFLLCMASLSVLSILTISLLGSTLAFISNQNLKGSGVINFLLQTYPVLAVLPSNLHDANSKLGLASGVISLLLSLICTAFGLWWWPDGKRTFLLSPYPNLPYLLLINASLSTISSIYLLATYTTSSTFDPNYRGPSNVYDKGTFGLESWACQLGRYQNDFPDKYCHIAKAGRITEALHCVVAIVAAVVGTWILNELRDTIEQGRRDRAKMNEYWVGGGNGGDEVEIPQGIHLASL